MINGGMSSLVGARSEYFPFFEEDALGLIPVRQNFRGVLDSLTITRYARERYAYTKGFKLSMPYSWFRDQDSIEYSGFRH